MLIVTGKIDMPEKKPRSHPVPLPHGEKIVGMCVFKDQLYVATDRNIYVLVNDELERIEFAKEETPNA